MKTKYKISGLLILLFAIALIISSCEENNPPEEIDIKTIDYGGKVNKVEELGFYTAEEARQQLQFAALYLHIDLAVETECDFSLYRFTYETTNYNDTKIWVSGLMGVPETEEIKGLLSYQHGTTTDRTQAPSAPSLYEGMALSSIFAANGYLFIAADYIGLGLSYETPTYLHSESTVSAITDFISIGEIALKKLTHDSNHKLFLMGFSQGGHATAATQRSLEENNTTSLNISAVACVAGAYNLFNSELPFITEQNNTYFTAYLVNSYAMVYDQPIESVIKDKWADSIPVLFDGSMSTSKIMDWLPPTIDSLMNEDYLTDIETGTDNWLTLALKENETYNWKPVNPLRIYYGEDDITVSPDDAIATYNHMKKLGGNVELVDLGSYDHMSSIYHSLPDIQAWFKEK